MKPNKKIFFLLLFSFFVHSVSAQQQQLIESQNPLKTGSKVFKDTYFTLIANMSSEETRLGDMRFYGDYLIAFLYSTSDQKEHLQVWNLEFNKILDLALDDVSSNYNLHYIQHVRGDPYYSVSIYGNYLFFKDPESVKYKIFDLSSIPDSIEELQAWDGSLIESWDDASLFNKLTVRGNYVYETNEGTTSVVDISAPSNPLEVATLNFIGRFHDDFFYVIDNDTLKIFDIKDPANPVQLNSIKIVYGSIDNYIFSGDTLFILSHKQSENEQPARYYLSSYAVQNDLSFKKSDTLILPASARIDGQMQIISSGLFVVPSTVIDISDSSHLSIKKKISTDKQYYLSGLTFVSDDYGIGYVYAGYQMDNNYYHYYNSAVSLADMTNLSSVNVITDTLSFSYYKSSSYEEYSGITGFTGSDKYMSLGTYYQTISCAMWIGCDSSEDFYNEIYKIYNSVALEVFSFTGKWEKGGMKLKWDIKSGSNIHGFYIRCGVKNNNGKYRVYDNLTYEIIPKLADTADVMSYEFTDKSAKKNRTYKYELYFEDRLGERHLIEVKTLKAH